MKELKSLRLNSLYRQKVDIQKLLAAADEKGESELYKAILRVQRDQNALAIKREEELIKKREERGLAPD